MVTTQWCNDNHVKCNASLQYEELVPGELCKTYEDARKVFKAGSKFVENAIKYYTFDGFVTDYVEIKQVFRLCNFVCI